MATNTTIQIQTKTLAIIKRTVIQELVFDDALVSGSTAYDIDLLKCTHP